MVDKENNNNVVQFPKTGNEALATPYDSGYLRWIRLTANDKQLLGMRDEMRTHRANVPIYEQVVAKMEENHKALQNQFIQLSQLLCYLVAHKGEVKSENPSVFARHEERPEIKEVLALAEVSLEDLQKVNGLVLNIDQNEAGTGWEISVCRPADDG